MTTNIANCNFCFPKLIVSPSYGEAMRYHAEYREGHSALDDAENYPPSFQRYIAHGTMEVAVDWGSANSSYRKMLSAHIFNRCASDHGNVEMVAENPVVELTVHRIGCRPAMTLLASSTIEVELERESSTCSFSEMQVTWSDKRDQLNSIGSPEYLVTLKIMNPSAGDEILRRTLHVAPPPIGPLQFQLREIVWGPKLFDRDEDAAAEAVQTAYDNYCGSEDDTSEIPRRRRGFGLELETVRMPLTEDDFEAGCFTQQQEFAAAAERARKWHLSTVNLDRGENYASTIERINSLWDQFKLWSVSHDLYVENAAAPSRIDLYERIRAHIMDPECKSDLDSPENEELVKSLDYLVLGGKPMPDDVLKVTPYKEVPISQASPEYKSPLPPHELYHEFPARANGTDQADAAIRLFLDGILKNPSVSTKPVAVPLVSDLGQSSTSIHVHVNVTNPVAWPREALCVMDDVERTQSLLCVIFAWVCYDRVVQNNFCYPNVWRDRSFAPMLPTGPELSWKELSWEQGTSIPSVDDDGVVTDANVYNLPAWFRHVHQSYSSFFDELEENKKSTSLFDTVFDLETMTSTISRWNSLNLLPINSYGTVEFRRMHASLDADFVSAWTWFCVGFVEKFSSPDMYTKYLHQFLTPELSWDQCLERLADAQNNATIEDLIEIMCTEGEPALPKSTLHALMRNSEHGPNQIKRL